MTDYIKHTNQNLLRREHVDFNMKDAKGRALGVDVRLTEYDVVEDTAAAARGYGYTLWAKVPHHGHYYEASTQSTRAGKKYGALTRNLITQDRDEADRWLARRVEVARKRAATNAA